MKPVSCGFGRAGSDEQAAPAPQHIGSGFVLVLPGPDLLGRNMNVQVKICGSTSNTFK